MKKIFLFVVALLTTIFSMAQSRMILPADGFLRTQTTAEKCLKSPVKDATYRLTDRISSDGYEVRHFYYNDQNRIHAIKDSMGVDQVIDSVYYNEQGKVSEISGYQWLNNVWKNVYRVYYTYDVQGNMLQRTNYNSLGTEIFTQGGVYDYTYDDQNRPTGHTLYLGDYEILCETAEYFYNAEGNRIMDILMTGFDTMDSTTKIYYYYNAQGRLSSMVYYSYNGFGWDESTTELFEYDAAGNCIDHSKKNEDGEYFDRKLYEYGTVPSSEVSMPYYIPEQATPEAFDDANMRLLEHWYTWDDNFVLQYVCNYAYLYNGILMGVNSQGERQVQVGPNPTSGYCTLQNEDEMIQEVSLYDSFGRLMRVVNVNDFTCYIDLTKEMSGLYLLKVSFLNGQSVVKKVVKE